MGDLVRVILVYKSGLVFFLTVQTKKLGCTGYMLYAVLNICKFLTLVLDELHPSVLHVNRLEFCQEFNGDGPRHVTHV